ncbi:hypothetical protein [Myxosarcina sp. GI1]|uniref:hypothetical protein n=1 Tax=Myxosarcina sp. GI1 TaxID=1541065 RepID=UPI00055BEBFD|nr:hypothetical protein [Myxosarcina sp. GI1]
MNEPNIKNSSETENLNTNEVKKRNNIYIVGGEKGGVGKSVFCRQLVTYFMRKKWQDQFKIVEADPTINDVHDFYQDKTTEIEFSDDRYRLTEPDEIFKLAIDKTVVVNLPSNVSMQFNYWLQESGILSDDLKKNYGQIVYFFVSDGSYRSVEFFTRQVQYFADKERKLPHALVLNQSRLTCSGTFAYLNKYEPLLKIIKEHKIPVLFCPELTTEVQFEIDWQHYTYEEAVNKIEFVISKQRIKSFLNKVETFFDEIFQNEINKLSFDNIIKAQEKNRNQQQLPDLLTRKAGSRMAKV